MDKINPKKDYGCLMLDVHFDNWDKCLELVPNNIVYDDEKHKFGKETTPHITILFGFDVKTTDKDKLKDLVLGFTKNKPVSFKIIGLGYFMTDKFDVLKFDIESPELTKLNELCKSNFEFSSDHDNYNPHITISYVKKGILNDKRYNYIFPNPFTISSTSFVYSSKVNDDKNKFTF